MANNLRKVLGLPEKKSKNKDDNIIIEFKNQDELKKEILSNGISLASIEELKKALKEKEEELNMKSNENTDEKKDDDIEKGKTVTAGKISFRLIDEKEVK